MKRTQRKDAFRNIKKQKVSWIAVAVISMLSVMAYLGINFASRALADNGNGFFDRTVFRDVEIISTLLVTPEDVEALKALPGISDAEGVLQTTGNAASGKASVSVDVVSLTERINVPMLLDGRLPENVSECALEQAVSDSLGVGIGDLITVENPRGGLADYLKASRFTVTGIVYHPDHASLQISMPGNRDVIVLPEAFDDSALNGCFMKTVALFDGVPKADRFSDVYRSEAEKVLKSVEALGEERAAARSRDVRGQYETALRDGETTLNDGKQKLDDARKELDDGWAKLASGEQQLSDSEKELSDGKTALDEAGKTLGDAEAELETNRGKLEASQKQLSEGLKKLTDGEAEYALSGRKLSEGEQELSAAKAELETGRQELNSAETRLSEGRRELVEGYREFRDGLNGMLSSLGSSLTDALGDYAALLDVSLLDPEIDPDDPDVSLSVIEVGEDLTIDLSRSLSDNIFTVVSSLGIPEATLRTACERIGGVVSALADRVEVIRTFTDQVILYYNLTDLLYGSIADATTRWDAGHGEYLAGKAAYQSGLETYEAGKAKYEAGLAEYEAGLAEYRAARKTLDDGWKEYNAGKAEFDKGAAALAAGEAEYQKGKAEYEAGLAKYEQGLSDFEAGKQELANSRKKLEDGEKEYQDGLAEYEAGAERLAEEQKKFDDLSDCHWVVLGAEGNAGYVSINHSVGNIAGMGITFALVFILVGAIMIYATSGRIVEEQRTLIGATKALGLFSREIFAKYAVFGVSATVLGMIFGVAAGYFGLQRILLYIYGRYYVFGSGKVAFVPGMMVIVFLAGILLSAFAVWFACLSLLRSTATSLMQAKAPTAKRRASKTGKSGKSLYSRLILRNMLSDKKRLAVTVISIAGCCALLTAGFTMRAAVLRALSSQFETIVKYDLKIGFTPDEGGEVYEKITAVLDKYGVDRIPLRTETTTYSFNGKLMPASLISGDLRDLDRFYARIDTKTGALITDEGDGLWINQRTEEVYGITPGDQVTLFNSKMDPFPAKVSGAFRLYAGKDIVLSADCYKTVFGKAPECNSFYAFYGNADAALLKSELTDIDGVEELVETQETRDNYMEQASVMNLIAVIMIVIAGLMAYFILLNLTSMYIQQKKRELTIMRINGFTTGEVIQYVLREMIVTTLVGIVFGLGAGAFLGYQVIQLMESISVGFLHNIQWDAWIYATLITVVYSVLINAFVLRKVKHLKLTDVA